MASTSPKPGIQRAQSRRKSSAHEFPPIFDQFRGPPTGDGLPTVAQLRRRRNSKRRFSETRSASRSRPQPQHGILDTILNLYQGIGPFFADYLWPLAVWLFTLVNVVMIVFAVYGVSSFLAEHVNYTTDVTQLQRPECLALSPSAGLCWSFPDDDARTASAEAIWGEYTGTGASTKLELPSAQIERAKEAAEQTWSVIHRALGQVENMKITSRRTHEVAHLVRKWDEKHKTSVVLFQSLLSQELAVRESMLLKVRALATHIAQHEDELVNSPTWGQVYAWVSSVLPNTAAAILPHSAAAILIVELEDFVRKQATHANNLAVTAGGVRNALTKDNEVRKTLKITLPINWRELGEEVDVEELQHFLQHGSEVWIQNALKVADTFQKQYRQLSDQYYDTFMTVRDGLRSLKNRAALVEFIRANVAGIKQSLAESERRLAGTSQR